MTHTGSLRTHENPRCRYGAPKRRRAPPARRVVMFDHSAASIAKSARGSEQWPPRRLALRRQRGRQERRGRRPVEHGRATRARFLEPDFLGETFRDGVAFRDGPRTGHALLAGARAVPWRGAAWRQLVRPRESTSEYARRVLACQFPPSQRCRWIQAHRNVSSVHFAESLTARSFRRCERCYSKSHCPARALCQSEPRRRRCEKGGRAEGSYGVGSVRKLKRSHNAAGREGPTKRASARQPGNPKP